MVCQSIVMCSSPLDEHLPPANEVWGKVIFLQVCVSHSVHRRGWVGGHLCMMSPPVWLPGPMFLLPGICAWSHVPSQGYVSKGSLSRESVSKDVSLSRGRGLCPGGSLSRGSLSRGLYPRVSLQECVSVQGERSLFRGVSGQASLYQGGLYPGGSLSGIPPIRRILWKVFVGSLVGSFGSMASM